jgi:lipid A 3-O-deacylase
MKPIYIFLISLFLFLGCSRPPMDLVVAPYTQQLIVATKPANPEASRQAREFPIQSIVKTEYLPVKENVSNETHLLPQGSIKKIHRQIILELPEGESYKRQISPVNKQQFVFQTLMSERRFSLTFENDIFDMTDRYYTNGVRFEWTSPTLAHSPMNRLMLAYGHPATNTYSVYLIQNMYTPISTKIPPELSGNDRPYAAYMILGHRKETSDAARRFKITNDIIVGVIGSNSLGSLMQKGVHHTLPTNDPPLGWETQINNDVVADYRVQVEKTISGNNNLELGVLAAGEVGTLYDNLMTGFRLETKKNSFSGINQCSETSKLVKHKLGLQAYLQSEGRLIGYDATLQGGMFNHDNIYILKTDQIEHLVLKTEVGVSVRYLQYGLELGQTLLSREYAGGKIHKWGRITLNFYFR